MGLPELQLVFGAILNIMTLVFILNPNATPTVYQTIMIFSAIVSVAGAAIMKMSGKEKAGAILVIAGSLAFAPFGVGLVGIVGGIKMPEALKRGRLVK